jgi:pyruvate/2-oxoglutarate/acetoin dehydrogenase E1 component
MYAQVPGLRVVVPSSPADAKGLLTHALRCHDLQPNADSLRLLALCALAREESRGVHFRSDFPQTNPHLDQKHCAIQRNPDGITVRCT